MNVVAGYTMVHGTQGGPQSSKSGELGEPFEPLYQCMFIDCNSLNDWSPK